MPLKVKHSDRKRQVRRKFNMLVDDLEAHEANNERHTTSSQRSTDDTSSSTTLTDDTDMTLPVDANSVYLVELLLIVTGDALSGLKVDLSGPAGFTRTIGDIVSGTLLSAVHVITTQPTPKATKMIGQVTTGSTAGDLTVQWAKDAALGGILTMHKGSAMILRKAG